MLQGLCGGEAPFRIVLEEACEELVSFCAEGLQCGLAVGPGRGGTGTRIVINGVVVPLLEVGAGWIAAVGRVLVVVMMMAVGVVLHCRERVELAVLGHRRKQGPAVFCRQAYNLGDFVHLVPLEGDRLLTIHLGLLSLEYWPQGQEFREDASHSPHVDGGSVMVRAEDQLGCSVPYCHNNLIAAEERVQWFVEAAGQAQVANLDLSAGRDHDVGGLEITVQNPVGVQVLAAVEELEHDALDRGWRYGVARLLRVMVDDLQQVVLGILKHHEDALVFENDFHQPDDVWVSELAAEAHLTDGALGNARVADLLALLVRLELFDGHLYRGWSRVGGWREAAGCPDNGDALGIAGSAYRFVNTAVCSTADETNDAVAFGDTRLGLVTSRLIATICIQSVS